MMLVGCAHATIRWIPAPRFHKDKLRGNDEGECPPEADRGFGGVPQFPNLPPRMGARGLKASRAQSYAASGGHSPPYMTEDISILDLAFAYWRNWEPPAYEP
jgi:hypothetical protein